MTKFSRIISLLLLSCSLLFVAIASADSAQSYLQGKQRQLTELIQKPQSAANDKKLEKTFDTLLDYRAFAKDSLGKKWDEQTAEEQKEFEGLLTTLVRRSYTKNLRDTLDYRITFQGEHPAKVGALVQTIAKHKTDKRKETVRIDYLVHKVSGSWRVYDIITEGESLVRNYKNQFRRVMKKKGFEGLLEKMRKKARKG